MKKIKAQFLMGLFSLLILSCSNEKSKQKPNVFTAAHLTEKIIMDLKTYQTLPCGMGNGNSYVITMAAARRFTISLLTQAKPQTWQKLIRKLLIQWLNNLWDGGNQCQKSRNCKM